MCQSPHVWATQGTLQLLRGVQVCRVPVTPTEEL